MAIFPKRSFFFFFFAPQTVRSTSSVTVLRENYHCLNILVIFSVVFPFFFSVLSFSCFVALLLFFFSTVTRPSNEGAWRVAFFPYYLRVFFKKELFVEGGGGLHIFLFSLFFSILFFFFVTFFSLLFQTTQVMTLVVLTLLAFIGTANAACIAPGDPGVGGTLIPEDGECATDAVGPAFGL
jgi:hypothetical protein